MLWECLFVAKDVGELEFCTWTKLLQGLTIISWSFCHKSTDESCCSGYMTHIYLLSDFLLGSACLLNFLLVQPLFICLLSSPDGKVWQNVPKKFAERIPIIHFWLNTHPQGNPLHVFAIQVLQKPQCILPKLLYEISFGFQQDI